MTTIALERRYRLLLLAYPRRYRRRHGVEILTTLMEMSDFGQTRPTRADAWHLIGSGLRQRFRIPGRSPLAVAGAVLAAVILAAFGAAAGSAVAAATFARTPDDAALRSLLTTAGATGRQTIIRDASPWWGESAHSRSELGGTATAAQARAALAASGWHTTAVEGTTATGGETRVFNAAGTEPVVNSYVLSNLARFQATRDGVRLQVEVITVARPDATRIVSGVGMTAWPAGNASLLPLIVIGLLLGGIAGWLTAAAVAQRLRTAPRPRRITAAGLAGVAAVLLALPAAALSGNVLRAFRYAGDPGPVFTVHAAFTPGRYYPFGPDGLVPALTLFGLTAVAALLVTAVPRGREVESRTETVRN